MQKKFTPTTALIRAAETLMLAMAHEGLVRPIVEAYEAEILQKHQWHIAPKWVAMGLEDRVVLSRKHACLLSEEDAKVFYQECFKARDAARLRVSKPENDPLCEAENLRVQAEAVFIQALSTLPGLSIFASKTHTLSLDTRKLVIDIGLKLLAPFVGNSEQILARVATAAS